jgi:hypothetical protein
MLPGLKARLSNDVGASRVLTCLPGHPSAVQSSNGEVDTQVRCIVVKIARVLVRGRVLPADARVFRVPTAVTF